MEGYTDVYDASVGSLEVRAIIGYFPDLNQLSKNKICNVTILYCGNKDELTKGVFYSISDDITKLIQKHEDIKFKPTMKNFEFMMTQHFFVEEIPDLTFHTHGTFSVMQENT